MDESHRNTVLLFLVMSLAILGCGAGRLLGPAATPSPTNTPAPISTLTPTITLTPTLAPTPTIEPPSQLANIFEGARLTYFDSFDSLASEQWNLEDCESANEGQLRFACSDTLLSRNYSFNEGEGILMDFQHVSQPGAYWWGMHLVSGDWRQDDWRSFGIAVGTGGPYVILDKGNSAPVGYPALKIKSDTWYRLALAVGQDGAVVIVLWERDKPDTKPLKRAYTLGKEWAGLEWLFWVNSGTSDQDVELDLDNYYQFTFTKVR